MTEQENEITEKLISLLESLETHKRSDERKSLWGEMKKAIKDEEVARLEFYFNVYQKTVTEKKDNLLVKLLEEKIKKMKARLKIETSPDFIP